jgi:hypothetical protein
MGEFRSKPRGFFGHDHYAARALGTEREVGSSFADADIHVGARGLSESVIPDSDEQVLKLEGDYPEQVKAVEEVLLERSSGRELWTQYSLPAELQSYVTELVEHGEIFVHFYFDRLDQSRSYSLFETTWLAPETMLRRTRDGREVYEQFASRQAFQESGYALMEEPREYLCEFATDEVLHLRWPLQEPDPKRSPAQVALDLGEQVARYANRSLLAARASVETEETFLPLARAKAGAYADALERQQNLSAAIKDMLFYPGAMEAEIWPWVKETTDYFRADRMLRSRIGICKIREYLFGEFNRQVLKRWVRLNDWGEIRLSLRPVLFTEADWRGMRTELEQGQLTLEDVRAAILAEWDAGHQFSRAARLQAEAAATTDQSGSPRGS